MRPLSQLASDEVSNATDLGVGGTSSSRRTIAIEGTSRVRCHGPDNLIKRLESFSRARETVPCSLCGSSWFMRSAGTVFPRLDGAIPGHGRKWDFGTIQQGRRERDNSEAREEFSRRWHRGGRKAIVPTSRKEVHKR